MQKLFVALVCSAALIAVYAECPNACSGHGTCGNNDECTCYHNWMAADCSERVCPFGLAFVDTPRGDLNHDGLVLAATKDATVMFANTKQWELYPNGGPSDINNPTTDEAHYYAECSSRGICDRELGTCACFDGHTGSSCQRTVCPNDCSGHGVCRTVAEVAGGSTATNGLNYRKVESIAGSNYYDGVTEGFDYTLWDADKHQTCVCDPGYIGNDCSLRECPRGDDPLTHRLKDCGGEACADEVQTVAFYCHDQTKSCEAEFALEFKDWTGYAWRTKWFPVVVKSATTIASLQTLISTNLKALPNSLVADVGVSCTQTVSGNVVTFLCDVTFTKNPGNLDLMMLKVNPKFLDASKTVGNNRISSSSEIRVSATESGVRAKTDGNKEEVVCSNRGLCDYESGLCKCFKGYYNHDCSKQNALAGGNTGAGGGTQ